MTDTILNSDTRPYLLPGLPQGGPRRDGMDAPFWNGLREEKLNIQKCEDCGTWQWGPEWICHNCHSFNMGWQTVPAEGIIYSWQRCWHPSHPALKEQGPYLIVLIELPHAGNVRIVGNLLGDPEQDVKIGTRVRGVFEHNTQSETPITLLQWEVAS